MSYKIDRHQSSHQNTTSPEILVGQIWLQDEPTAVEIIELNTSDEFDPSADETRNNHLDHVWSYADSKRFQKIEDNYKINKKARERRRLNHENHFISKNTPRNTHDTRFINNNYDFDIAGNHVDDNTLLNHQVNCFTIINKHFIDSDTSTDGEYADVEIITSNELIMEHTNWEVRNPCKEEITYDLESDKDTRTIWIYSFKNKHLLSEDGYTNKNPKDTSSDTTSCSIDSDVEQTKDRSTNVSRIGSPVPPNYIPRLNLSLGPTLSTVTEVSEPNRQPSSNRSYKSPNHKFKKSKNSWFINECEKLSGRSIPKLEKSTNIVNWMGLSPREKRRRSKEQGDRWEGSLLKLEALPIQEVTENIQHHISDKSEQDNAIRLQVDVDVHVSVNEKSPEKGPSGTPNSAELIIRPKTCDKSQNNKVKNDEIYLIAHAQDRGDHGMKYDQNQQLLCVTKPDSCNVTGPIPFCEEPAAFDKAAFKREEAKENETASYDYVTNKYQQVNVEDDCPDNVWMRNNIPLLKPSEWKEYLPITESPALSIHLSMTTVTEEQQSWFKRFIKYINCCSKIK